MSEVLLINPRKRRRRKKTARKKTTRRAATTTTKRRVRRRKTTLRANPLRARMASRIKRRAATRRMTNMARRKKRTYKKNPSRARRTIRTAARRARASFGGLNFKTTLKDLPWTQLGMFAAKWASKRFGASASETDPESWGAREYLQGGLGAVVAGFVGNMIKPGIGQKILEGGVNLVVFKLVQNELITKSEWATEQFGAQQAYSYQPGDVETNEQGVPYLLGQDNVWRPLQSSADYGQLEPVGPLGALEPVGPLGSTNEARYRKALLDA